MTKRQGSSGRLGWLVLGLLAIAIGCFGAVAHVIRPFQAILGSYSSSLSLRSPEQRRNILSGVAYLDGVTVEPGELLSFNSAVGPRTTARGFVSGAAFLDNARLETIGGGICQLSSTLYAAALHAGLRIVSRVAHNRTVASVPAGLDATVWYGKADFVFANDFQNAVRVSVTSRGDWLCARIYGDPFIAGRHAIQTEDLPCDRRETRRVRVWRLNETNSTKELISDDRYVLSRKATDFHESADR